MRTKGGFKNQGSRIAVSSGRTMKVLTVVDEYTHVALAVHGAHSITARTVKTVLAELFERHGAPAVMR